MNIINHRFYSLIITFEFVKELSLEYGVSEGLKERLDILLLARAQSLTAQRNHPVLQRIHIHTG